LKPLKSGVPHPNVGYAENNLGWLYDAMRAEPNARDSELFGKAEEHFKKALDNWVANYGDDDLGVARVRSNLGWLYHTAGHSAEARELYEKSLAARTAKLGKAAPDHPDLILARYNLALLDATAAKSEEAAGKKQESQKHWAQAAEGIQAARRSIGRHLTQTL